MHAQTHHVYFAGNPPMLLCTGEHYSYYNECSVIILQFSTKTLGQIFFDSWGRQGRTQDITILSIVYNPDHSILVADS